MFHVCNQFNVHTLKQLCHYNNSPKTKNNSIIFHSGVCERLTVKRAKICLLYFILFLWHKNDLIVKQHIREVLVTQTHRNTDVWFGFQKNRHVMRLKRLVMRTSMKCWQPKTCTQSRKLIERGEQVRQSEVFRFTASVSCLRIKSLKLKSRQSKNAKAA